MKLVIRKRDEEQTAENKANVESKSADKINKTDFAGKEIVELRGRYNKTFTDGHGKSVAKFFGTPVHYKSENDKYEEIDNTLSDKGNYFETKANSFKAKFSKTPFDGKIFEINNGSYGIEVVSNDVIGNYAYKNRVHSCDCNCEECKVNYRNVKDDVDFEYAVKAEGVKENIVVNKKSDKYEFSFDLKLKNLVPVASVDGEKLQFIAKETGKEVFNIPAPIMEDAKGERSDKVYYEIEDESSEKITLKVIADENWINSKNTVLPVTIDPQINAVEQFVGEYEYNREDSDSDSIFRYITITPYNEYVDNELRVYCLPNGGGDYYHANCRLVILKDRISEKMLETLKSAKLTLSGCRGSYMSGYSLVGNDESTLNWYGDEVEIDLMSEFSKPGNEISIWLENDHPRGGHRECSMVFDHPILELEFEDYITKLEIEKDPNEGYDNYFPGDKFNPEGMVIKATYYSGETESLLYADGSDEGFKIAPDGSLATYDDYITITYKDLSITHSISVYQKGFNDRRPNKNLENVYKLLLVDKDTGNPVENNPKEYYVKLTLADGAIGDRLGTPLNAENLNKNLILNADNIYGKIGADKIEGIIPQENLPEYLRESSEKGVSIESLTSEIEEKTNTNEAENI